MHRIKSFTFQNRVPLSRLIAIALPLLFFMLMLSQTAFAQNTYVITDGNRVLVHTTYATDPAAILDEAGLELGADDTYTTQQGNGVSEILVRRGQTVNIDLCGEAMTAGSYGETVGELLQRLNLDVSGDTSVSVPLDTMTHDGMELTISRTVHATERYTKTVAHKTIYCEDATLAKGTRQVLTEGRDGEMRCTTSVVYRNGEEISHTVTSETVAVAPVDEVIALGTGADATAEPVPGGNPDMPIIGDGTITTSTGEVLTYTRVMKVVATGYNNTNAGCNEYTATGTIARVGAIAVDPRMIPYGTRMFIVSDDGEYVYGIATAEDCGGNIVNNRVDLYFDTNEECFQFGVRDCTVYILG